MGAAHSLFYWWILGSQSSVLIIRAEDDDVVAVGVAGADLPFAGAAVAVGAPGVPAPDRGLAESPYEGRDQRAVEWKSLKILLKNKVYISNSTWRTSLLTVKVTQANLW